MKHLLHYKNAQAMIYYFEICNGQYVKTLDPL